MKYEAIESVTIDDMLVDEGSFKSRVSLETEDKIFPWNSGFRGTHFVCAVKKVIFLLLEVWMTFKMKMLVLMKYNWLNRKAVGHMIIRVFPIAHPELIP